MNEWFREAFPKMATYLCNKVSVFVCELRLIREIYTFFSLRKQNVNV